MGTIYGVFNTRVTRDWKNVLPGAPGLAPWQELKPKAVRSTIRQTLVSQKSFKKAPPVVMGYAAYLSTINAGTLPAEIWILEQKPVS